MLFATYFTCLERKHEVRKHMRGQAGDYHTMLLPMILRLRNASGNPFLTHLPSMAHVFVLSVVTASRIRTY
jgi:hypothetical protein